MPAESGEWRCAVKSYSKNSFWADFRNPFKSFEVKVEGKKIEEELLP